LGADQSENIDAQTGGGQIVQPAGPSNAGYKIVKLGSGAHSIHSYAHGETFHPVIGPVAEAESLYVNQLQLLKRLADHSGEFVIWDVGLGAAANALTVLRATGGIPGAVRLVSFDNTIEPLEFAFRNAGVLGYFGGYESHVNELLRAGRVEFRNGKQAVNWELQLADFPSLLAQPAGLAIPKPHAILFDAFSPAKNSTMWTLPLFTRLFSLLDPNRPCALPTYSRSTMLRVTLLLAGFFVGVGHATGFKEETTIAANALELLAEPLDQRFLQRARISYSAEPMHEPVYRQLPLTEETWEKLQHHRQFKT
jgi:tRNA U34 5-methylaminomethyl-2-thiouridine-forming methyltransferase MnmC